MVPHPSLTRRSFLATAAATPRSGTRPLSSGFEQFIAGVKAEARKAGIRQATVDRAFQGVRMNQQVIDLDRRQPEFTLTWDQYRSRIVAEPRISRGRELYAQYRNLLAAVAARYEISPGPILGIWGLGIGLRQVHRRVQRDRGAGDAGLGRSGGRRSSAAS